MASRYDRFNLVTDFELRGDQARAIDELVEGLNRGDRSQVLLGVTGSGKTFTMAQCIARVNRPTLVMAHNKTLAAQLYQEFRRFFPENAVEYFVSYYDYYQPEAYVPTTDSYIEKEATINDEIDRMRLSATRSLFERRDVIIVASVSCIYGLGLARGLLRADAAARARPAHRPRADPPQARRDPVRAQRSRVRPRRVPRPRRHRRGLPLVRGPGAADRTVRRRGGRAGHVRSAHGQDDPAPRQGGDLPEDALRHDARPHEGRRGEHQGGAGLVPRAARVGREGARSAPAAPADDVRPGDDQGDWLLPRDRELLAAPDRARRGRAAADAAGLPAAGRPDDRGRKPPDRAADPRDVPRRPVAEGSARGLRVPAALGARQSSAQLRRVGAARDAAGVRLGDARPLRAAARRGRRRRADHPADGAARSGHRGPPGARDRSTTCSPGSASGPRAGSGSWSRR